MGIADVAAGPSLLAVWQHPSNTTVKMSKPTVCLSVGKMELGSLAELQETPGIQKGNKPLVQTNSANNHN